MCCFLNALTLACSVLARDVKRGQELEDEAEAGIFNPKSKPRPNFWPRGHSCLALTSLALAYVNNSTMLRYVDIAAFNRTVVYYWPAYT